MRLKVLLVEDDFGDAALVEIFLNEAWVSNPPEVRHVICVSDAKMELARERFDIVLCDLSLPDAEGVETVIALRDCSQGAPIVVLTGRDDPDFSLSLIERGAQDYLNKRELTAPNLMRAIRYAIERDRQAAQLRVAMRIEQLRREILVRIAEDSSLRSTLDAIGAFLLQEAGCTAYLFSIDRMEDFEGAEAGDLRWSDGELAVVGVQDAAARLYAIATSGGQVLGSLALRVPEYGGSDVLPVCAACDRAGRTGDRAQPHPSRAEACRHGFPRRRSGHHHHQCGAGCGQRQSRLLRTARLLRAGGAGAASHAVRARRT